jgi:hypothetical protein
MSKDPHPMSESIEGLVARLKGHRAYHLAQAAGQGYSPLSTATGHTELARVLDEAASVLLSLQGGNSSSSQSQPGGGAAAQRSTGLDAETSGAGGPGYERGSVLWHCSEEEGGPDVGIQVGLGSGWSLYFGEIANATLEEHEIGQEYPDGWWVVLYGPKTERILGAVPDTYEAREAADEIAALLMGPRL